MSPISSAPVLLKLVNRAYRGKKVETLLLSILLPVHLVIVVIKKKKLPAILDFGLPLIEFFVLIQGFSATVYLSYLKVGAFSVYEVIKSPISNGEKCDTQGFLFHLLP